MFVNENMEIELCSNMSGNHMWRRKWKKLVLDKDKTDGETLKYS